MPYLSFLAINYNILVIIDVQRWFESCIIRNYANSMAEHQIMLSEKDNFKKHIVQLLNDMGIDISRYRYDNDNQQFYLQRMIEGEEYELSYDNESDGTKKLFPALPVILITLEEGRLIIVDELDAKLHPKLLRYVISMFTKKLIEMMHSFYLHHMI